MIICHVSTPAVKVTEAVSASDTQRPKATSQLLVALASAIPIVVAAPAAASPSFLVTVEAVVSQAPRQVVGPVPVMAAFWKKKREAMLANYPAKATRIRRLQKLAGNRHFLGIIEAVFLVVFLHVF